MATHVPPAPPAPVDPPPAPPGPTLLAERMAALRDVAASQQLVRLEPSATLVAQLERVARGELTTEDVIANIHARLARDAGCRVA